MYILYLSDIHVSREIFFIDYNCQFTHTCLYLYIYIYYAYILIHGERRRHRKAGWIDVNAAMPVFLRGFFSVHRNANADTYYKLTHWYAHTSFHIQVQDYSTLHTGWHCMALDYIGLHCIALHHTALPCITLHYTALHCIALHDLPFIHTYIYISISVIADIDMHTCTQTCIHADARTGLSISSGLSDNPISSRSTYHQCTRIWQMWYVYAEHTSTHQNLSWLMTRLRFTPV